MDSDLLSISLKVPTKGPIFVIVVTHKSEGSTLEDINYEADGAKPETFQLHMVVHAILECMQVLSMHHHAIVLGKGTSKVTHGILRCLFTYNLFTFNCLVKGQIVR